MNVAVYESDIEEDGRVRDEDKVESSSDSNERLILMFFIIF